MKWIIDTYGDIRSKDISIIVSAIIAASIANSLQFKKFEFAIMPFFLNEILSAFVAIIFIIIIAVGLLVIVHAIVVLIYGNKLIYFTTKKKKTKRKTKKKFKHKK